jgi:uncharacterized protein with PQ loop repeat
MSRLHKVLKTENSRKLMLWICAVVSITASIMLAAHLGVIQTAGWVYSLAFALSGLPQMFKSIREGHSRGVADGTMLLWMMGELGGLIYGIGLMQWPIIFNCLLNTIFVGIIVMYRLFPRVKEEDMK